MSVWLRWWETGTGKLHYTNVCRRCNQPVGPYRPIMFNGCPRCGLQTKLAAGARHKFLEMLYERLIQL